MKRKLLGMGLATMLVAGCAAEPGSPEAMKEAQEAEHEQRVESVGNQINQIPTWYLETPTSSAVIFGAGSGVSDELDIAVTKATILAKRRLAGIIESQISSMTKTFAKEQLGSESAGVQQDFESVTINLIKAVTLQGFNKVDTKVLQEDGKYHAYVLLELPYAEYNQVLQDSLRREKEKSTSQRKGELFDELEKYLERKGST